MSIETRTNLTRRDFLKWTGVGTASLAAMLGLAACGTEKPAETTKAPETTAAPATQGGETPTETQGEIPDLGGVIEFRPGRVDIDKVETGHPTTRDTLVIRLDEQPGTWENVTGGYHPQVQMSWILSGCYLLCEGYTPTGVDFMVNKYSVCDSYEYDDDFMGITMHIRDNAFFHNGDPVTSEDVIFCTQRYKDVARNSFIDCMNAKAIDEKTFYIPFFEVNVGLSGYLGRTVRVFSKKLFEEAAAKGDDYLYGTFMLGNPGVCGMYEVTEWIQNDHIYYKADHNFYVNPNIENVTIRYITDNTVAMMELATGGIDILYSPQSNDIQDVLDGMYGTDIDGITDYSDMMMMLGFNLAGPLADKNLRQAIIYATDWKSIVDNGWGPLGAYPTTPMAYTMADQPDITEWWEERAPVQLDKAKEYMAASAYPNGGLNLIMDLNNEATKTVAAEIMNKNLEPLGITLSIQRNDTATWDNLMRQEDGWDMWIRDWGGTGYNWSGFLIPTGSLQQCTHCEKAPEEAENVAEMNRIGGEAQLTLDPEVQSRLSKEIWDLYMEDKLLYWFPMVATRHIMLGTSKLKNWYRSTNNYYIGDAYFED